MEGRIILIIIQISIMNIGFDSKRIFYNSTGLGNYSRTLVSSLETYFPENNYYLFTPAVSGMFNASGTSKIVLPSGVKHRIFRSVWRSKWVVEDIRKNEIAVYHGLSGEIPFGTHHFPVKTVVTVHDLIFERYPHQYNPVDVFTYRKKAQYACKYADRIIAISEQTRNDLIAFYHVPKEKIKVIYQSCDSIFGEKATDEMLYDVRIKYQLPENFLLYVGSVVERKNLLTLVQSISLLPENIPLIVVGSGHHYQRKIKAYLSNHKSLHPVTWLCDRGPVPKNDLAVIYRLAKVLIYPSVFEGFGLPVQEALRSGTPVITSRGSCFSETGGDAALYVDPMDIKALAKAIFQVCHDDHLAFNMKRKGLAYSQRFTPLSSSSEVIEIYNELCSTKTLGVYT